MPGNELEICKYLFHKRNVTELNHLGVIKDIGAPISNGHKNINNVEELSQIITQDSRKKADVYINNLGVSLKQKGGSFPFNRLQRAELASIYQQLSITDINRRLAVIDSAINSFHNGQIEGRSRQWTDFFIEMDFKNLVKFLMMEGSPNYGRSTHPANFILEANSPCLSDLDINVYTFDEYFSAYSNNLKVAFRRQWVGQKSTSEHRRASGLARKQGNAPWVFDDVVGKPRTGWNTNFPKENRKTVYFLMIEKVN